MNAFMPAASSSVVIRRASSPPCTTPPIRTPESAVVQVSRRLNAALVGMSALVHVMT